MGRRPLVSIVTPALNATAFIEETIKSVLSQSYREIEYIIMDGGSTDGTVEILRAYADDPRFRYTTQRDAGTADAVNRGFRLSRGEVFAFLNADDMYTEGAVEAAIRSFESDPTTDVVYGDAAWVKADGHELGRYPTRAFDAQRLKEECFICQPASFIRRAVFEEAGLLNTELHFAFDYDLWIRLSAGRKLVKVDGILAKSRMHPANKTLGQRRKAFAETIRMLKSHYGYVSHTWVYTYTCCLIDGRDQFFEPIQPGATRYLASLPLGLYYNLRHPLRYLKDWVLPLWRLARGTHEH